MDIDYQNLGDQIGDGTFESRLEDELTVGFRALAEAGDALPVPSHYATRIAEVISQGAPVPLTNDAAYYLYQSILSACEKAWANVMGAPRKQQV